MCLSVISNNQQTIHIENIILYLSSNVHVVQLIL